MASNVPIRDSISCTGVFPVQSDEITDRVLAASRTTPCGCAFVEIGNAPEANIARGCPSNLIDIFHVSEESTFITLQLATICSLLFAIIVMNFDR